MKRDDSFQSDDSHLFATDDGCFLKCLGLVIHPNFRNQDVISQLVKAQLIFANVLENVTTTSTEVVSMECDQAFDIGRIMKENMNFKFEMRRSALISRKT